MYKIKFGSSSIVWNSIYSSPKRCDILNGHFATMMNLLQLELRWVGGWMSSGIFYRILDWKLFILINQLHKKRSSQNSEQKHLSNRKYKPKLELLEENRERPSYLLSQLVIWWWRHLDISDADNWCVFLRKGWRKLFLVLDSIINLWNDLLSHVPGKRFAMPVFLILNTCGLPYT